jgi:hypothetical protein
MRAGVVAGVVVAGVVGGCDDRANTCIAGKSRGGTVGIDYRQVDLPEHGQAVWEVQTINRLGQLGAPHRVTCRELPGPSGTSGGGPGPTLRSQEPDDDDVVCLGYTAVEVKSNPYRIQVRSHEASGLWSIDEWVVVQLAGEVSGVTCDDWDVLLSTDGRITWLVPGVWDAEGNLYADLGVD